MAPVTPEATVLKAVFAPETLAVGSAVPPHERWAKSVLERQLTDREALKRKLKEGQEIIQDSTKASIKGIKERIEGIGTDIDPEEGTWKRPDKSSEQALHERATKGITRVEELLQYESLPPSKQVRLQQEVVKILEQTPGGKEYFDGLADDAEKQQVADAFIRNYKKDITAIVQKETAAINQEGGRFDAQQAADSMFDKQQRLEEVRQQLENSRGELTTLEGQLSHAKARKAEFDAPAAGNAGDRLKQLETEEPLITRDLAILEKALSQQTGQLNGLAKQISYYDENPGRAKADKVDVAKLRDQFNELQTKLEDTKAAHAIQQQEKMELQRLRTERDRLPQDMKSTQESIDQKKLAIKKAEVEVKKAADHARRARQTKEMMDEDLATVTADLWKNVIKTCVGQKTEEMIDLVMSTEGMDHIQAEMLTLIDRKTEEEWTEKQKRWRMGTRFGGRVPAIRSPVNELVNIPKRSAINTAFDALLADTDGSATTAKLKGIVGTQEWDSLPRDQQHELEAAYVVKLVGRRQEALGVSLRAEEIRRIRSGPFADALIKQGLVKNPEFRQALSGSPDLTAEELAKPTAETVQKIKGKLDGGTLMTVLMLGLTPLSMIKTSEEHR